jgi:nucleotide-binding universal stress UspA family protein
MYRRILVPIDGSPTARRGLDEAIVIGTHGRRGMVRRMLLGSDAEQILRAAPVPVMLVHGPEDAR